MAATDHVDLRMPTRTLVGLLMLAACASSPPEPVSRASAPAAAPAASADPPISEPAGESPREELEASLAAYEQQLASNEARLQAMGVRLAQRSIAGAKTAEEKDAAVDDRFAPPPPAAGDADTETRNERAKPGKSKAASRKNAPRADAPAPADRSPAPRPTTSATGRAGGGFTPPAKPTEADNDEREPGRCAELCDLASSTCELEAKICDLAARHPGEPRYEAVCQRADDDCRLASEACYLCSP